MAAGAWTVYNKAKKKIGNGTISLAATVFRMTLHTSAMRTALTLSTHASLSGEIADGNGYSTSGKALTSEVWTVGASAGSYKFDADDAFWSANGGSIANIKYGVIWLSAASAGGRHILCRSLFSASPFTLSTGNRLTVTMNTLGILTLA